MLTYNITYGILIMNYKVIYYTNVMEQPSLIGPTLQTVTRIKLSLQTIRLQHDGITKNTIQTSIPVTEFESTIQRTGDYEQLFTEILTLT
jgi:hypothetical protein